MTVDRVRVGEVLELQRRPVAVDPMEQYRLIGVYSFGKGIFHREPRAGSEIGDYRFFRVEPGDLVLSNIQAWEGAIGYATDRDHGTIGTHRFLTYRPTDERVDADWARWFFLSEPGMELIRKASPGTTMRNRTLAIERFESLTIPLPSLDEQQRIAAKLGNVRSMVLPLLDAQRRGEQVDAATLEAAVWQVFERGRAAGWPTPSLREIAEINPSRDRLPSEVKVQFVPMSAVDALTGTIQHAEQRHVELLRSGYRQFRGGDVIFARITPCMQNGKTAVCTGTSHAYGSTEFHVIRPGAAVLADWIHRFLRTRHFRNLAKRQMTGTAGQQRVPASVLSDSRIPLPSLDEQHDAIARIDEIIGTGLRVHDRRLHGTTLARALLPAAINEAFATFK